MSGDEHTELSSDEEEQAREIALDIVLLNVASCLGDDDEQNVRSIAEQLQDSSSPLYAGGQFETTESALPCARVFVRLAAELLSDEE